ncbi:MAG: ATP-binding protein, partial [Candidatus Binatia bacterium]
MADMDNVRLARIEGKGRGSTTLSVPSAIAELLIIPGNFEDLYEQSLTKVLEILGLRHGNLRLLNPSTGELELKAYQGFPTEYAEKFRTIKIGERSAGRIIRIKGPVVWDNIQTDPSCAYLQLRSEGINSLLGVPLLAHEGIIGSLFVASPDRGVFGDQEVQLLTAMGRVLGISIENSRLISILKSSMNDLTKLTLRLEESDGIKNRLFSVISHEFRTPITVILSNAELLADGMFGDVNGKQRVSLLTIRTSGVRLLFQIENALDIAQLEAGALAVHSEPFLMRDIQGKMSEALEDAIERKRLEVHWEIEPGIPPLFTDSGMIAKIFRNLIDNAIKFTERGRVTVRVHFLPERQWVQCEVEDTGIGIPAERFEVIFDPFHQVDSSHTRLYGGMGLGLRYVRRALEL